MRQFFAIFSMAAWIATGCTNGGLLAGFGTEEKAAKPGHSVVAEAASASSAGTWVQGARIDGANGIHFGPDGRLYVASVFASTIFVLDPESGEVLQTLGPGDGVGSPDDVAFGPDGTLCWTDILGGEVGCRRPGGETTIVAKPGVGVNPITFSDDGRLFVAQCFFGNDLFEIDPTGQREPRTIRNNLGDHCGLNGMDWGPDGKLYGPRWFHGEVVRVDVETGEMKTVAEGFGAPAAVKFDSKGRLHVLDTKAGKILRIAGDGTTKLVANVEPGADNIAFDAEDNLYVSSFVGGFVDEILGPNEHRRVIPGGPAVLSGLTVAGDRLVVGDFFSLRQFDLATAEQVAIVRDVIGFSDLGSVLSVHGDTKELVLASWNDDAIRLWNPETNELVAVFGERGRPLDALRFGDEIVYTGFDSKGVRSFRPDSPKNVTTRLQSDGIPAGLAVDDGALYVTEHAGGRLLQLAADGEWLPEPRVVASGFERPEGIVVASDTAWVVETGPGRVRSVDLASGKVATVTVALTPGSPAPAGFPPTMLLSGIARDDAGNLYVGDEAANRIVRIRPE